jgi:hypothetical protein
MDGWRRQGPIWFVTALVVSVAASASEAQAAGAEHSNTPSDVTPAGDGWGFDLAGFGAVGSVGLGWPSGDAAGPSQSVYEPQFALDLHLELSFAFVYVGGGFTHLEFKDEDPVHQALVNVETGDEFDAESPATAALFSGEIGIAHGIGLGKWFAVRPGLGFGVSSAGEVNLDVANCIDCARHVILEKYVGGKFIRVQLGGYLRIPGIGGGFGVIASYQQFLGEVDEPALNRTLLLGFAFAGGGGI